jgi:hypothetical protein
MPTGEMKTLLDAHHPRIAAARRKRAEHEALTGHSVYTNGWRVALFRRR